MKNFLFLIFMGLFVSCEIDKEKSYINISEAKDSILFYHNISEDENLTLNQRQNAINTSFHYASKNGEDTLYCKVLYRKNLIHLYLKEYDSLQIFNNLLINTAKQIKDEYILGKQYYLMGYYFREVAHIPDSAFNNYNRSKNYFEQTKDSSQVGINLLNMGTIQKDHNDFFGSKETITEALQFFSIQRDRQYIANCFNTLATDHRKLLNHQDAIIYYLKAIETTDSETDKLIYENNLAASYTDNKQYNNAIGILKLIIKDTLSIKNPKEHARASDNLAYTKWLSGINKKVETFLIPLQLRKEHNDKRGQIASYTHLGEFYSEINPKKAESYFDTVIQLSKTLKIPKAEKDVLKFLMEIEPNSVVLRDRYVLLQDSLYAQELKVKTQFAKYKYDDKLKQESILRLGKKNAEKELEASQQRNQKIVYLGGLLFITSVFGLSLYGFRQRTKRLKQKSKAERLEAIHETEAELSRKLHDDHGGKLNQVMLMVQRNVDKSVILDKLESIYNQIRNFSREINAVETGPDFWKGLKATLEYTKPTEVELILNGGKELDWSLVGHQTKAILFKVLQELVINMSKHSKATQAVILFKDQNKGLYIYYEDDGVGASEKSLLRKNGLYNTEKRIHTIGGSITFDSEEKKGFRTEIQIPK